MYYFNSGESEISEKLLKDFEKSNNEILSHWHPNLTINIMNDQTPMQKAALPEVMKTIYTYVCIIYFIYLYVLVNIINN